MNFKITASYFMPFGLIVLAGSWMGVYQNEGVIINEISAIGILLITAGYTVYISLFCFGANSVINALPILRSLKSVFYVFINLILHVWIMNEFSESDGWIDKDRKAIYNRNTFIMIFFFVLMVSLIFWTIKDRMITYSKDYIESTYAYAFTITRIAIFYVTLLVISSTIFVGLFTILFYQVSKRKYYFRIFEDSLLLSDAMVLWVGITACLLFLFILNRWALLSYKKVQRLYIGISITAAVLFSVFYSSVIRFNSGGAVYHQILVHYNPLWLDKESRGHTEFDI